MRSNYCAAMMCGRPCRREHLMCKEHWYQVPPRVRRAILGLVADGKLASLPYWVARGLAIREVAHAEGIGPSEQRRAELLGLWRAERARLQRALGSQYGPAIAPFVVRLQKLMDAAGGTCPLETCELALQHDAARGAEHDARRVAAALDLAESGGGGK